MISLKKITQNTRKTHIMVEVDGKEEKLEFTYRPNAYTPLLEKQTQEQRNSDLAGDILISMLVPVIDTIDMETEPGKPVQVTPEGLSVIPLHILNELMAKVNEDMDPGKKKSDDSGGSFSA